MKYIRHEKVGFILWPNSDELWHSTIGHLLLTHCVGEILSAGFVYYDVSGKPVCSGRSESLGIAARADDTAALREQLRCP